MILDDKLQEVYALEKREREVVEQERLTFALDAFRLKYKTNGDKENNHTDDESKESDQRPKFLLEACSEDDKKITELSYDVIWNRCLNLLNSLKTNLNLQIIKQSVLLFWKYI